MFDFDVSEINDNVRTIIHITADWPDNYNSRKTKAVSNLIDFNSDINNVVYSINRIDGVSGVEIIDRSQKVTCLTYKALPYGFNFLRPLRQVANWIYSDIKDRNLSPGCVHAHKLTIEGIIGLHISQKLDCPLICSIWGNTDQKIIKYRPDLHRQHQNIIDSSTRLLPATPWIRQYIKDKFIVDNTKFELIPIVTNLNGVIQPVEINNKFVSIFNLNEYKNKNFMRLLKAFKRLSKRGIDYDLDVYGNGNDATVKILKTSIKKHGLENRINICGYIPHDKICSTLSNYKGFILPSIRETFGMVFIESLYAGIPVIYPRGQSIDGFFPSSKIGYACDPKSVSDIVDGIQWLSSNELKLKEYIRLMNHSNEISRLFNADLIRAKYKNICESVCQVS